MAKIHLHCKKFPLRCFCPTIAAQDARRAADFPAYDGTDYNVRGQRTTVTSSAATLPADMPRRKPENEAAPSYMPGMTEKKKKRGILGLFSKRKEGKFKLVSTTFYCDFTKKCDIVAEAGLIKITVHR